MATLSSINVRFALDLKEFSTQMQNAQRQLKNVGTQFTKVGSQLTVGLTAPITALGLASVIAFDKQAKAVAQVETGLRSTGNTAGKTLQQLKELASGLQNNSLFGDEQILQDVTAQLLTFTNIAGVQFDRTQQAALDLATRLDGDLKSASIQLGKALNDPIKGLAALAKSGIQFSEDQKTVIKSLVETGRLADAQTLILDELEKQYGGSAAAAAAAGSGPLKQLSNSIGDLTEDFGKIITEAINPFIKKLQTLVASFQGLDKRTKKIIAVVATLAAALGPILVTIGLLSTTVIPGLITAFTALTLRFTAMSAILAANPFGAVIAVLGLLAVAFLAFRKNTDDVIKSQTALSRVNDEVTKSVAAEQAKLNELLVVARDERVSKEQRIKAIKELNALSPKFLGDLTLEKINTDQARIAIDKYNQSLIATARVKAAQNELVKIEQKLIKAELSAASSRDKIQTGVLDNLIDPKKEKSAANIIADRQKNIESYNVISDAYTKKLTAERDAMISVIQANEKFAQKVEPVTVGTNKLAAAASKATTELQRLPNITGLQTITTTLAQPMLDTASLISGAVDQIAVDYTRANLNAAQFSEALGPIMEQAAESFATGFGQLIASAAQGGNFIQGFALLFLNTLADMAIQVGKTAIGIGIAVEGIKVALQSLNPAVAIAAGIALVAIGTLAKSALSRVAPGGGGPTPFAKGGIVYGPTNALVGEYAGAKNNPEIIAPLSKLKELIEPAGMTPAYVTVGGEFILRGNDLVQVVQRTESRNNRTR